MAGKKQDAAPPPAPADEGAPAPTGAPDPLAAALDTSAPAANGAAQPAPAAGITGDDGGGLPAADQLSDDQIFSALQDPRASVLLDYIMGTNGPPAAPGGAPAAPASETPAPHSALEGLANDDSAEINWTEIAKLAEQGDTDAVARLATTMAEKTSAQKAAAKARETAMVEARKEFYGELANLPEMQELSPTDALKLMTAMRSGPGEFVRAVSGVLVAKRGGGDPAAGNDDAQVAAAYGQIAANQQAGTPSLPPASPQTGAPAPDATTKEAPYDVFSRILEWEANETAVVPPIPK